MGLFVMRVARLKLTSANSSIPSYVSIGTGVDVSSNGGCQLIGPGRDSLIRRTHELNRFVHTALLFKGVSVLSLAIGQSISKAQGLKQLDGSSKGCIGGSELAIL
jgi:hypothetical protein